VFTRPALGLRSPLAASPSGQALPPGSSSRRSGLTITRHHRGFTYVHPSGLPLARSLPRTERGPLGCSSSSAPPTGRTRGRTSRRGPISNTDQELRTRHNRPPIRAFTRCARPRVAPTRSTSPASRSGCAASRPASRSRTGSGATPTSRPDPRPHPSCRLRPGSTTPTSSPRSTRPSSAPPAPASTTPPSPAALPPTPPPRPARTTSFPDSSTCSPTPRPPTR